MRCFCGAGRCTGGEWYLRNEESCTKELPVDGRPPSLEVEVAVLRRSVYTLTADAVTQGKLFATQSKVLAAAARDIAELKLLVQDLLESARAGRSV